MQISKCLQPDHFPSGRVLKISSTLSHNFRKDARLLASLVCPLFLLFALQEKELFSNSWCRKKKRETIRRLRVKKTERKREKRKEKEREKRKKKKERRERKRKRKRGGKK